jgi:hypothetical protein
MNAYVTKNKNKFAFPTAYDKACEMNEKNYQDVNAALQHIESKDLNIYVYF